MVTTCTTWFKPSNTTFWHLIPRTTDHHYEGRSPVALRSYRLSRKICDRQLLVFVTEYGGGRPHVTNCECFWFRNITAYASTPSSGETSILQELHLPAYQVTWSSAYTQPANNFSMSRREMQRTQVNYPHVNVHTEARDWDIMWELVDCIYLFGSWATNQVATVIYIPIPHVCVCEPVLINLPHISPPPHSSTIITLRLIPQDPRPHDLVSGHFKL